MATCLCFPSLCTGEKTPFRPEKLHLLGILGIGVRFQCYLITEWSCYCAKQMLRAAVSETVPEKISS